MNLDIERLAENPSLFPQITLSFDELRYIEDRIREVDTRKDPNLEDKLFKLIMEGGIDPHLLPYETIQEKLGYVGKKKKSIQDSIRDLDSKVNGRILKEKVSLYSVRSRASIVLPTTLPDGYFEVPNLVFDLPEDFPQDIAWRQAYKRTQTTFKRTKQFELVKPLTPSEESLLNVLAANPGRPVPYWEIWHQHMTLLGKYDQQFYSDNKLLTAHKKGLVRAAAEVGIVCDIQSIYGVGYILKDLKIVK